MPSKLSFLIGAVVRAVIVKHHWGGLLKIATAIDVGYSYVSVLIFSLFACLWGKAST